MLRIATDKSINGHSLAIVPRDDHPQGYIDAELDDEEDGTYWDKLQKVTLAASIRSTVREVTIRYEHADHCAGSSRQAVANATTITGRIGLHTGTMPKFKLGASDPTE